MMTLYLIALFIGGSMLAVSLFGGDHDQGSHGHDPHGHDGALDAVLGWLPLHSLRFWVVFAAFFGLTGTVLSLFELAGWVTALASACAVGYVSGLAITKVVAHLRKHEVSSAVGEGDLVGATGEVILPIDKGQSGKVRLAIKDRTIDVVADGEEALAVGAEVVVFQVEATGRVIVTRQKDE
jgi:membrane protein implicated in regulation of membrane protease activity